LIEVQVLEEISHKKWTGRKENLWST